PIVGATVGVGWELEQPVRTDGQGRYSLPGWTGEDYEEVHVVAEGYGREEFNVGVASQHDFELVGGGTVVGRLLTEEGATLPGGDVFAAAGEFSTGAPRRDSFGSGRTLADGRFRIDGLRRDLPHVLIVPAPKRARVVLDFDLPRKDVALLDVGDVIVPKA